MNTLDISILEENLDVGEHGDKIVDYGHNYHIGEVLESISTDNVDVYNSDLYNFISEEPDWVEEAIDEFGWDGVGKSLTQAAQMGESLKISADLYDSLENIVQYYALSELEYRGVKELDEETYEDLCVGLQNFHDSNKLSDIDEFVEGFVEEHNLLPSLDERSEEAASLSEEVNDGLESKEQDEPEL